MADSKADGIRRKLVKKKALNAVLATAAAVCISLGAGVFGSYRSVTADDDKVDLHEIFDTVNSSIVAESASITSTVKSDYASGIKFKLNASGSYIDYSRIIDLNKVNGNVIEIVPNTDVKAFGLKSFRIRLTDAYDASNSITVSYEVNRDGPRLLTEGDTTQVKGNSTLCASFIKVGFMGAEGGYANYTPEQGTVVAWSQNFLPAFDYTLDKEKPFYPCGFSYDNAENSVYVALQDRDGDRKYLAMDLDNEEDDYPDFTGFTTGEVMLTIESMGSVGEFVVTKIGNDIMADLANGIIDDGGLMFGGYDFENMLNGVVGYPYPMPVSRNKYPVTAKLEKLDGENWVDVTSLLTENGTKFTPSEIGNYRLSYTGKTNSGTDASVSGEFKVIASPIEITEKAQISLSAKIASPFIVPDIAYEGGIGKLTVEYTAEINGEKSEVSVGDAFMISQKGTTILIKVKVTDKVEYTKEFSYPVAIDENVKEFKLVGSNLITVNAGNKITVPDFIANDYAQNDISRKSDVTITSDLLSGNLSVGNEITVDKNGSIVYAWGDLQIVYRVVCAPKTISTDNISSLFYQDGISKIETTSIGTEFTVSKEDVTVTMPNPVSASDLAIEYSLYNRYGLESKNNYNTPFTAVNVILKSESGKEIVVYIDKPTALRPALFINGKRGGTLSTYNDGFVDPNDLKSKHRKFSFSFDNATAAFYDGNGNKIKAVTTWSGGLPFDGFDESKVYVSFELIGGQSGNRFVLNTLSNQKFASSNLAYGDMGAPALALEGTLKDEFVELGSELDVPMAYAYDVLSSRSRITMTITAPNGDVITKESPRAYKLVFDKAGKYSVKYDVSDGNRNSFTYEFNYRVLDKQPPVITVDGEYKQSYSGKVKVLSATVSDNDDASAVTLTILLEKSDLTYTVVESGKTLSLKKGKYAISYFATDADGNVTYARYEFEVK